MNRRPQRSGLVAGVIGAVVAVAMLAAACGSDGSSSHGAHSSATPAASSGAEVIALHSAMERLWADHMQWTYATVDAFFHNASALDAALPRLLANQDDIGNAVKPFYGDDAGAKLTELLRTHINEAVPVLKAAQAGDDAALKKAQDDWYANAQLVADFLSQANPTNWPQSATRPALQMHIDQTTAYAVDLLKGDYVTAIQDYGHAFDHMMELADLLADGIVKQFPDKFQR